MTFRERPAGWISGGALTDARANAVFYKRLWGHDVPILTRSLIRLSRIAAMETPGAAPAAKRMARVTKEALK